MRSLSLSCRHSFLPLILPSGACDTCVSLWKSCVNKAAFRGVLSWYSWTFLRWSFSWFYCSRHNWEIDASQRYGQSVAQSHLNPSCAGKNFAGYYRRVPPCFMWRYDLTLPTVCLPGLRLTWMARNWVRDEHLHVAEHHRYRNRTWNKNYDCICKQLNFTSCRKDSSHKRATRKFNE